MNRRWPSILLTALLAPLALAACGPTMLEKRIIEQPDPALLRPGPSPEELSGEVPMLEDIQPALTLVPADHDAPRPPDDPRPVALKDAPKAAPPMPPAPARAATPTAPESEADAADEADAPRRGGVRINPR